MTPGALIVEGNLRDAADDALGPEHLLQDAMTDDPVLERNHQRFPAQQRRDLARRRLHVPELDAEHHDVGRGRGRRIVGHGHVLEP